MAAHRERFGRLDVLSTTPASGIGAPVGDIATKKLDMQLDVNLRSIILFYREASTCCKRRGRRARQRARGQHGVDLGQARRGLAVGLQRDEVRGRGLHPGDAQGARRRRIKSTALCPAFVDTPMTDFVKGQVAAEEMIQTTDIAEMVRALLRAVARLRRAGDPVHPAGPA